MGGVGHSYPIRQLGKLSPWQQGFWQLPQCSASRPVPGSPPRAGSGSESIWNPRIPRRGSGSGWRMAPVSGGGLSGEKKGWLGQLRGRQLGWLKLGFLEPVSRLQIQGTDGSHSFLIGTKLRGAGWLCCLAWLSGGPGGSWYQEKSLCRGDGKPAFLKQHGVVQGALGSESLALTWGSGGNPGFGVRESPPVLLFILNLRCLISKMGMAITPTPGVVWR